MKLTVVAKSNGTITNASASILRGKLGKKSNLVVRNGSTVESIVSLLAEAGHEVTVTSYFELAPARQKALFTSAHKARVKAGTRKAVAAN